MAALRSGIESHIGLHSRQKSALVQEARLTLQQGTKKDSYLDLMYVTGSKPNTLCQKSSMCISIMWNPQLPSSLSFLGAFARLRNTTISFVVRLSVCPHGITRLPVDRFWWNLMFELFFRKSVEKIQVLLKSHKERVLYVMTFRYFWRCVVKLFLEREMFQTKLVEKIKHTFYVQ
jgi:hypothetical protein